MSDVEARGSELRKLQGEGVQADDLDRAKAFYAGSTRIGRESSNALATEYGRNYVLSVPLDSVDRILRATPGLGVEDLRAVARKYLGGENYVYAAVRGSSTAK